MTEQTDRLNTALAGRYRIERHLGEGGMASVYLCEDLKHKRKVALKLLKPELAAVLGAERFVQEITTTASLQHPHILPLFDSGTADGFLFYVMPLVEGETLREKLNRETQLAVDEAVRIAREVLDALEYAHQHGIVHRDVKPENILLHGGHAMVADFGIALAVSAAAGGRMTETGLSLGTPHYMSPEQATAEKEITARSDVYSLGSVLYEMLTGSPPHTGSSAQQIIMKIITTPAEPVTVHRKSVPPNVAAAVAKSLEKLPADRFESAKAFADALGNTTYTHAAFSDDATTTATSRRLRITAAIAVTVAVIATATAMWSLMRNPRGAADEVVRLSFSPTVGPALSSMIGRTVVISPDGRLVVYSTTDSVGRAHLFARRLDDLQHNQLSGTDNASDPFFSPDGRWIGFRDGQTLKKVPVDGGTATPLADIPGAFYGATWGPNGVIVSNGFVLLIVPSTGGAPKSLTAADSTRGFMPVVLPGGNSLAFASSAGPSTAHVVIMNLTTRRTKDLGIAGQPLGVLDGQLLFVRPDGALMAVPFDASGPTVNGEGQVVISEVQRAGQNVPKASLSAAGSLVYVRGSALQELVFVDAHGVARPLPIPRGRISNPVLSPDGKRLIAELASGPRVDVMMYDLATGAATRMTFEGASNQRAQWSPDGKRILYRSNRSGDNFTYWWKSVDGSDDRELVNVKGNGVWEALVTPDNQTVIFRTGSLGSTDIWYRHIAGDTTTKEISATRFNEVAPRLSPDGHWIAYQTDESGAFEVVVRPFPGPGASYPVSIGGGISPVWSRDGRKLFYWSGNKFIDAQVTTGQTFGVSGRKVLFAAEYLPGTGHAAYDVMPDGVSFVMSLPVEARGDEIVVIHNFAALLKARAKDANPK
jgi:serine/threonine-protein kinase